MRLLKSLLCVTALVLGTGTAFANQEWMSYEESYMADMNGSQSMAMEETDVIYIYPVEVTEYYILVPSESSEMPG